MYKSFTEKDFKKTLGLPEDYHVDGTLSYGSWNSDEQKAQLEKTLADLGEEVTYETIPNFPNWAIVFKVNNKRFWFDSFYGGARLSEVIHMTSLFGAKKHIFLGTCGGLKEDGLAGDIILPTYSVGNESATRMYNPEAEDNKHFADENLTTSIKQRLNTDYRVHSGGIMTCQAMLAETLEDIKNWSKEGYLGVEMETATVFAVAKHFNVPAAAILTIADNLIIGDTVGSENFEKFREQHYQIRDHTYKVALQELLENE